MLMLLFMCFSPCKLQGSLERAGRVDDEHRLIARYAARLAADANDAVSAVSGMKHNQGNLIFCQGGSTLLPSMVEILIWLPLKVSAPQKKAYNFWEA